jgi:hypothetical protein
VTEGLAVCLNGTDLPDEVYTTNAVNELVAALLDTWRQARAATDISDALRGSPST